MPRRGQELNLHEMQRQILEEEVKGERSQAQPSQPVQPPQNQSNRNQPIRNNRQSRAPPQSRGTPYRAPERGNLRPQTRERFDYDPSPNVDPRYAPQPSNPYYGQPTAGVESAQWGTPRAQRRVDRGVGLDVHELLKQEAFGHEPGAGDTHFEKNRPSPNEVYGVSDQYMILDSFSKLRDSAVERGEFKWNFMVQGVTGDQVIGVRDRIDTVISIQMGSFCVPILPEVEYRLQNEPGAPTGTNQLSLYQNNNSGAGVPPTLVPTTATEGQYPKEVLLTGATTATPWINNPYTQIPFCNRMTIQIREAGHQSYSDRDGARHHFEFGVGFLNFVGANPTALQAFPMHGKLWDTYIFTDPLKDLHGVSLIFRNPDIPISFLPDCLYDVQFELDTVAGPGPFILVRAPGHGLNMGDRIYIQDFSSGNSALDKYMNRPEGHVAAGDPSLAALAPGTPIVLTDPDTFYTDPAVSTFDLTVPVPTFPLRATVCIAKRRLRIPIRVRRVVPRLTNYITPVV